MTAFFPESVTALQALVFFLSRMRERERERERERPKAKSARRARAQGRAIGLSESIRKCPQSNFARKHLDSLRNDSDDRDFKKMPARSVARNTTLKDRPKTPLKTPTEFKIDTAVARLVSKVPNDLVGIDLANTYSD